MARGRMIDKRIAKSDKLAALGEDGARVLYFMIYPHADIQGRLLADAREIKEDCVPRLPYELADIERFLEDLDRVGLIVLYQSDGRRYLEITRYREFQSLREDREAKSKIPPPPGELPDDSGSAPALSKDKLSEDKLSEGKKKKGAPPPKPFFNFEKRTWENIADEDKKIWAAAYPACNIEEALKRMAAWLLADPRRAKSNYKIFIVNWLSKDQDRGGSRPWAGRQGAGAGEKIKPGWRPGQGGKP